jgi:hypothetical protein
MAVGLTVPIVVGCTSSSTSAPAEVSTAAPAVTPTEVPTSTSVPSSTSTPVVTGWDYVALGDSNSRGFGVSHPYVEIYGNYIAKDLGVERFQR